MIFMALLIATTDTVPLTDVFRAVLFYGALAEVVGLPIAWLRVRRLEAWKERPDDRGPFGLLSLYIAKITALVILWGVLLIFSAAVGSRL